MIKANALLIFIFVWPVLGSDFPSSRLMKSLRREVSYGLVSSIESAREMAKIHCENVFKWNKWNCPESAFSSRNQPINKEFAYIQAITSASLVYAITKNCSRGEIENCGCDMQFKGRYADKIPGREVEMDVVDELGKYIQVDRSWGGCSDDVLAGDKITMKLLEKKEERDVQAFVELRNTQLGRKVVKESMTKRCKCHGISGSCEVQTCWMQLAPFMEIAENIKSLYKTAHRINAEKFTGNAFRENNIPKHSKGLLYVNESPDYCLRNKTTGCLGTVGRKCSKSMQENVNRDAKISCRNLCRSCGHRVRKSKKQMIKKCNCRFSWCCEVNCETCTNEVEEYFCE